jgi:hypothetical protein
MIRYLGVVVCAGSSVLADGGRIVVANDEWTLSNQGFANAGQSAQQYVSNVIDYFGGAGDFLAVATNFGLTQPNLKEAVEATGSTWTVVPSAPSLQEMLEYDGVFSVGTPADMSSQLATAYVNAGGRLYIAGGAAAGGEVQLWNGVLHLHGLSFEPSFNGIIGNIDVSSADHPVLEGVQQLYQNNGSSIVDLGDGDAAEVIFSLDEDGLYAVVEDACSADFNADGTLNILDFVAFQGAFVSQSLRADCDGNMQFDILDFVCYQGVFAAGCQ